MFSDFQFPTIAQAIFVSIMNKIMPLLIGLIKGGKKSPQLQVPDWTKDTVHLFQFPRSKLLPNVSPFCLKVEGFLRVNNIKYEIHETMTARSEQGLLPFIEVNGRQIGDSEVIIGELKKEFNIEDYSTPLQSSFGRALSRTADGHLFYVLYKYKIIENSTVFAQFMLDGLCPSFLVPIVAPIMGMVLKRKATARTSACLGSFSDSTFEDLLNKDLKMYEDALGEGHKYLLSEKITEADLTIFGQLGATVYLPFNTFPKQLIKEKYPKVLALVQRIRDEVWGAEFEKH